MNKFNYPFALFWQDFSERIDDFCFLNNGSKFATVSSHGKGSFIIWDMFMPPDNVNLFFCIWFFEENCIRREYNRKFCALCVEARLDCNNECQKRNSSDIWWDDKAVLELGGGWSAAYFTCWSNQERERANSDLKIRHSKVFQHQQF